MKYCVALLLLCLSTTYALVGFGSCPAKTGVINFDLSRFSGFWYENRALENIHLTQEIWGSCITILFDSTTRTNITLDSNKNIFSDFIPGGLTSTGKNFTRETASISTLVFGTNHTGAINADFVPQTPEFKIHGNWRFLAIPPQGILVLATDYDNWALLWSCTDMGNLLNKQNAWILSRSQTLNSTVSSTILTTLFAQGFSERDFKVTDQSNCAARASRKPFFSPLLFSQVKSAHDKRI